LFHWRILHDPNHHQQGAFGAFPHGKNELILTLFVGKLVLLLQKGIVPKKGKFIGFPPLEREK
jgi:hypothetical protein